MFGMLHASAALVRPLNSEYRATIANRSVLLDW